MSYGARILQTARPASRRLAASKRIRAASACPHRSSGTNAKTPPAALGSNPRSRAKSGLNRPEQPEEVLLHLDRQRLDRFVSHFGGETVHRDEFGRVIDGLTGRHIRERIASPIVG